MSLGKWPENWSCYRSQGIRFMNPPSVCYNHERKQFQKRPGTVTWADRESTQIFYTLMSPTSVQCLLRKIHLKKPPPKRARQPTREIDIDNSCEVTRESNMIWPIACICHNSLLDISEKPRVVSQILRSARKIWKNELITIFGLTAAITNTDEISGLKQAQEKRNSDLYRTSIQYTVLGNIHGKEVYLVPPQDAALLLEDWISLQLRTHLKPHNALEGVGQLANHTLAVISTGTLTLKSQT